MKKKTNRHFLLEAIKVKIIDNGTNGITCPSHDVHEYTPLTYYSCQKWMT